MSRRLHFPGGPNVSRETVERLELFEELVARWTTKINLISKATSGDIWNRHIVDSAQIYHLAPMRFTHWADFGSGGGFPAVVVAAMAAEFNPDARITMLESDQRKSVFLRTAVRELGLNAEVISKRIDEVSPLEADVISARALASLSKLLLFADLHLSDGGICIFPKGRGAEDEIVDARQDWRFELRQTQSITDSSARILTIKELKSA